MISGGAMGEELAKHFPEFKIFNDLHLCDYTGVPMYAIANGFYHLKEGFNNTKADSPQFKMEFCKYYRISPDQFDILKKARTKIEYGIFLNELGILKQWKKQADEGIKLLEELTGVKFLVDSERTQLDAPTNEQIEDFRAKVKSGYFTPKAIKGRDDEKANKIIQDKIDSINKSIELKKEEIKVIKALAKAGGLKAVENAIFYNHTRQLNFNWKGYGSLSVDEIDKIKARIKLPKGVTITIDKK
jgi:hypothetical protein